MLRFSRLFDSPQYARSIFRFVSMGHDAAAIFIQDYAIILSLNIFTDWKTPLALAYRHAMRHLRLIIAIRFAAAFITRHFHYALLIFIIGVVYCHAY